MKLIDLEAHFTTKAFKTYTDSIKPIRSLHRPASTQQSSSQPDKLLDLGEGRLKDMDESGINMQVLSLFTSPHIQMFEDSVAMEWASKTNDELSSAVNKHLDRFIGLAALPVQSPNDAAVELERSVKSLGLKGACIVSHARNEYLDDKKYWVIFETAEKLNVPIYLHPSFPSAAIADPYNAYNGVLAKVALGFSADISLHVMRLICSGLFDQYPGLKIILGHMGEGLPYLIPRIDHAWQIQPETGKPNFAKRPSEYLKTNFVMTTSGMLFEPAFFCCYMAMGADRMAFGVDYPVENLRNAVRFIKNLPICDSDKEKICYANAEALFNL